MKKEFIFNLIKLIIAIAILIVAGFIIYSNFIQDQSFVYQQSDEINLEELYKKFNIDVFEDKIFKDLVGLEKINTSSNQNIGRENPFLKF